MLRVAGAWIRPRQSSTSTNTAVFTSTSTDPNPGDNTSTVDTPVTTSADLATTKVASSETVIAGGETSFTITVTNEGPSVARGVTLTDTLPPGTSFVSIEPTRAVTCTDVPVCDVGDLAPGESFSAVLTIAVPPSAASGTLTNVATASSPTPDPNPGRRTATADVLVQLVADVSVVKTLLTNPVVPGQPVTYRIDVADAGPSDAINGTFVDPLPPGTTLAGGSPPPGATCRVDTTKVTPAIDCTMARLAGVSP